MKKQNPLISTALYFVLFTTVAFVGCQRQTTTSSTSPSANYNDVAEIAELYLTAMGNYKFDDAKPFATQETCEQTIDFYAQTLLPNTDSNFIAQCTPATVRIDAVSNRDTSADISFTKFSPCDTVHGHLSMRKRNGQWRAHVVIRVPDMMRVVEPDSLLQQEMSSTTLVNFKEVQDL
ncbi:MAG: hypothetical protein IJV22_09500 [Bacteroidales bacterium]|nr:hypothetical protein [Bacteroidales bacterium]